MPDPTPVPVTDLPKPPLADIPWLTKPSRKVWVFALSNILIQWALAFISTRWHFDLAAWLQPYVDMLYAATVPATIPPAAPPGAQAVLATGLAFVIAYLTSPSFSDVYRHLTSKIVARAILDTGKTDVSAPQIAAAVSTLKVEALLQADVKPGPNP